MHRIDRFIFTQLLTHEAQKFSQLKPPGIEGNTLTYRLQRLRKEGLVTKTPEGQYQLTSEGRFFTDRLNFQRFTPRQLPRSISLLVVRKGNEWLLHRRLIHPLRDLMGLPHSNIRSHESIIVTAQQRLEEMTGLKTKFVYRGGGYLTFYRDGKLESFNQVNILENDGEVKGSLRAPSREIVTGTYFWKQNPDFSEEGYIPSLKTIGEYLLAGSFPFFMELAVQLEAPKGSEKTKP